MSPASTDPGNRDGKIHSHRFPAANTALAHVNYDQPQMDAIEKFLKSGPVAQCPNGECKFKKPLEVTAPVEATV